MTNNPHNGTIDWNRYWSEADEEDRIGASPSAHHVVDVLPEFFAETSVPDSFADVGCGLGRVTFDVAERYPETTVVGYDAAEPALRDNRQQARERGLDDVRFERTVLPEFDPDRRFDVVFSYFTLCYVADVERALRNMYAAVEPGGYLVFNYFNRFAQAHWRTVADSPEEYLDESSTFDPDRYAERFELVLEGDSLLSYERIHDALGTWPQSFWSIVEKPDIRWAWRHHPLVYVPK